LILFPTTGRMRTRAACRICHELSFQNC